MQLEVNGFFMTVNYTFVKIICNFSVIMIHRTPAKGFRVKKLIISDIIL